MNFFYGKVAQLVRVLTCHVKSHEFKSRLFRLIKKKYVKKHKDKQNDTLTRLFCFVCCRFLPKTFFTFGLSIVLRACFLKYLKVNTVENLNPEDYNNVFDEVRPVLPVVEAWQSFVITNNLWTNLAQMREVKRRIMDEVTETGVSHVYAHNVP